MLRNFFGVAPQKQEIAPFDASVGQGCDECASVRSRAAFDQERPAAQSQEMAGFAAQAVGRAAKQAAK